MQSLSINDPKLETLLEGDNLSKKYLDDDWLYRALKEAGNPADSDFFGQWTVNKEDPVTDPVKLPAWQYLFYFDDKYHWIVKHPNGQDEVVDPELWAKFLDVPQLHYRVDRNHYLDTTVVDQFYGEMRLTIEIQWREGMVRMVNLVAPDGDHIKSNLKQFHISRDEAI